MRNRKNKLFIIGFLGILLGGITVGFAAFSNTLTISSKAEVSPDPATFKVNFSTDASSVVTNNVVPTVTGDAVASEAIIDNSDSPTLSNLYISFTEPGQSVSYQFYMINSGEYDAFLNRIVSSNATNDSSAYKVCTAIDGTNQSAVDAVCDDIEITISDVSGASYGQGDFYIDNYEVKKGSSILITVTIDYNVSDDYDDGDFIVRFGDISFEFNSVDS